MTVSDEIAKASVVSWQTSYYRSRNVRLCIDCLFTEDSVYFIYTFHFYLSLIFTVTRAGVERGIGQISRHVVVVALSADHSGVVAA